ncbi:MAG: hypothetical protein KGI34_17035, partial [Bradyrhizobium sp.]|nr:hypothetical protein [Bradyrhizobium sp.]
AEAVGRSIVSLQAGDSTRQRLEHFRDGLAQAVTQAPSLVPAAAGPGVICTLEAMQLKDTECELQQDIGQILGALSAIMSDAADVVDQGRSLVVTAAIPLPFSSASVRYWRMLRC